MAVNEKPPPAVADGKPVHHAGPGQTFVSWQGIVGLSVGLVLVTLFVLYTLWAFWPTTGGTGAPSPSASVSYFGWNVTVSRERLFFLIVALAGALGGLIHGVRSITWYVGNRNLRRSWLLFNLMLPIVGALGGTVFYVVLRAGLFSPSTSAAQASPFGFAAVAMLVGLFSEQALEKLRQLAAQMFAESPTGADHVDPVSGDAETPTTAAVTADQTGS
jgi:hypothetical protein